MERNTKIRLSAIIIAIIAVPILVAIMASSALDSFDLMIQVLFLAIMVPLIVMSTYMWVTGKGAMMISGYNTSPKALRDMYDSNALAKFLGKLMTISMVILLAGLESIIFANGTALFWAFFVISMAILFSGIYYMNTGNRFLKEGASPQDVKMTGDEKKRNRKVLIAVFAIIAIIMVAIFALAGSGSVSASLETDDFQVNAPFVTKRISYQDVTEIELRDSFEDGHRVGGFGGSVVSSGNFQNDELGRYVLARYNSIEPCIVVHHSDGILVFNLGTPEETTHMYDEIRSRL